MSPSHQGASSVDTSDDEHFSDASEGATGSVAEVPTLRVERVDDEQAHGEVPGTAAHEMRTQDAEPDELEIIPDGATEGSLQDAFKTSAQQEQIPLTVVEKVDPEVPSHGEVPGTAAHEIRKADAEPDVILKAPESTGDIQNGSPTSAINRIPTLNQYEATETAENDSNEDEDSQGNTVRLTNDGDDDDFDDFEEGNEDDDFGAFDEGTGEVDVLPPSTSIETMKLSIPDFQGLERDEVSAIAQSYAKTIFSSATHDETGQSALEASTSILTERSNSLWAQLVAPPPIQPPNWVRSRIRRLFLVSLGVPVDLDEILPASKQKKLVLPSMEAENERELSRLSEAPTNDSVARLRQANGSSTSVNSSSSKTERRRRGPQPPPSFDLNSTRLLCGTTDTALQNLQDDELRQHVARLNELKHRAGELLEYWLIQRDSATGDKEAFEEVIENLVKHAKKIRK